MRIKRVSPRGLTFYITTICNERNRVILWLADTGKQLTFHADLEQMNSGWYMWQIKGAKVQEAFPFLTADEREFLMTGLLPSEWNEIFPPEQD